jgi:Integrase core domain/Chromo (CHRromatin Organisation MOdifier) domain
MTDDKHPIAHAYYTLGRPSTFAGLNQLEKELKTQYDQKQIQDFMKTQDPYTLLKPTIRKFKRAKIYAPHRNYLWESDVIVLQSFAKYNDGFAYISAAIDVFTKKVQLVPIKDQSSKSIKTSFEIMFTNAKPVKLRTDQAKAYLSKAVQNFLNALDVQHYTSTDIGHCQTIERFFRTLRQYLWHYMVAANTYRYIDILDDFLESYHNRYHRSLKMTPNQADKPDMWSTVHRNLYQAEFRKNLAKHKYKVGQLCRISLHQLMFQKESNVNRWSEELFRIYKCIPGPYPYYRLAEYDGTLLKGLFHEKEIQVVEKEPDAAYVIEKVLRVKTVGGKKQYLVKYRGNANKYNTWITEDQLVPV